MIVHGPSAPDAMFAGRVPCCGRNLDQLEPGCLITIDPDAVTCRGRSVLSAFVEEFGGPTFIGLDSGIIDIGIVRDLAQFYGARWRPWKQHLHRRGVPRWARRLAGWRPHMNDFEMFREEWQR